MVKDNVAYLVILQKLGNHRASHCVVFAELYGKAASVQYR